MFYESNTLIRRDQSMRKKSVITIPNFESTRLLVVGDVMLDRYWFGDVNRISPEAPVPVVRIEKKDERLGGAANVARNAAALGAQVGLMGIVGDDDAGKIISSLLTDLSVHNHLSIDDDIDTIVKLRVISRQQQLLRIDFEEEPTNNSLAHKLTQFNEHVADYDVVVFSDYNKGALADVSQMIETAIKHGKRVLVDPKGDNFGRYKGASVLTPNRQELTQVVGGWKTEEELTQKAQNLRTSLALEALLLTRSEEGMTLYQEGKVTHIPTVAREVFDVSGAGDTVITTLAVMLGAGASLVDAVMMANRAGGIVVGKFGTSTITRDELLSNS